MPRLSLWKDGKRSKDYEFIDRRVSEMFTVGGTGVLLHKYLGAATSGSQLITTAAQTTVNDPLTFADTSTINIGDTPNHPAVPSGATVAAKTATTVTLSAATTALVGLGDTVGFSSNPAIPSYVNQSAQNIQDLLFLENRDRKYDSSVYKMRGIYQVADQDFDLSQFGLFLATGTLFMVFHINDMIDLIGRRIMAGDVLELQHLVDYFPLNDDIPTALKRFYVVSDCSRATEGYSPTWWPHLWRCKINPLVESQEYQDIINSLTGSGNVTVGQTQGILSTLLNINDAVIAEAQSDVPESGYDTSSFFIKPLDANGNLIVGSNIAANSATVSSMGVYDPTAKITGYLLGDGLPPNGFPITASTAFPSSPATGDYVLRTDYLPNRLFRWNGGAWIKIEDVRRTPLTAGANNKTLLSTFLTNTDGFTNSEGQTVISKQSLSDALRPRPDNS